MNQTERVLRLDDRAELELEALPKRVSEIRFGDMVGANLVRLGLEEAGGDVDGCVDLVVRMSAHVAGSSPCFS